MTNHSDHYTFHHAIISASADELFAIGLNYCLGQGVVQDYISAHKWFNLAAMKGSEPAKKYRCKISQDMTSAEIVRAQSEARALL